MWRSTQTHTKFLIYRADEKTLAALKDTMRTKTGKIIAADAVASLPSYLTAMFVQQRLTEQGWPMEMLFLPGLLAGAAGMLGTALGYVPVAVAFFAAAGLTILLGALPVREAYDHIEWPILILLGALIPVSDALRSTGGAELIAAGLSVVANQIPPTAAVGGHRRALHLTRRQQQSLSVVDAFVWFGRPWRGQGGATFSTKRLVQAARTTPFR